VWDVAGKRLLHRLRTPGENVVRGLVFSADSKTLVVGGSFDALQRWDLASGKKLTPWVGRERGVVCLDRAPDGETIASVGDDGAVRLWDAATGKELRCLQGAPGAVLSVAFSPDGKTLASGGMDGTIRLWDMATGKELRRWPTYHFRVWSLAFSTDSKYLASAGRSPVIGLWEAATGRGLRAVLGHRGPVDRVTFSPDGKTLASTGDDTTILLWDVARLFRENQAPADALTPQERELYWSDLSDPEESRVWQARAMLCAAGPQTTEVLRRRWPEMLAAAARLGRLLAQLDSDDFDSREKASVGLEELGLFAEPALRKALEKPPSPEVRHRVKMLLGKLPRDAAKGGTQELLRPLQGLALLEWINSVEARQLLKEAAQGPAESDAATTARAILLRLGERPTARP
jgi:hypothetical protein